MTTPEYIPDDIEPVEETNEELLDFYMENLDMLGLEEDHLPQDKE